MGNVSALLLFFLEKKRLSPSVIRHTTQQLKKENKITHKDP